MTDYEQFIQHVCERVTSQKDIAEMMGKNKGTVSKWARKALQDRRLSGSAQKLLPPSAYDLAPRHSRAQGGAEDDDAENDEAWSADFRD